MPAEDHPTWIQQSGESWDRYHFIDFGASKGTSLRWGSSTFGGRGVGIDIDPAKVRRLRRSGYDGICADAATGDAIPDNCVGYSTLIHFLEHLPGPAVAAAIIDTAVRASRDFVLIIGPDFGGKAHLHSLGLKKGWEALSTHLWHHDAGDLSRATRRHRDHEIRLFHRGAIRDSYNRSIIPLHAQRDGWYDPAHHGPKPFMQFDVPLHQELVCVIRKHTAPAMETILSRLAQLKPPKDMAPLAPIYG